MGGLLLLLPLLQAPAATPRPRAEPAYAVEVKRDIPYVEGSDADPVRHRLDVYWPKGKKHFPVLLFVHGGGWKSGDKGQFAFLGRALAGDGVGVVVTNYRLHPRVKFPANVEDVARAFAWTRRHIAQYGGKADRLFVGGHSAGGHLVSLLATDEAYLRAQGLRTSDIQGVISISGLYAIPRGRFPLFEDSEEGARKASPIRQVRANLPPLLLFYAEIDFPGFGQMAEDFARALREARCQVTCRQVKGRTHGSVAARIAEAGDPVRIAILDFVVSHSRGK
jgi:acetyl esterase/lipase